MITRELPDGGLITCCADANYALGACGGVVIAIWRLETHLDGIAAFSSFISERAVLSAKGVSLLQLIEEQALAPNAAARKSLAQMHSVKARLIRRSAVVYTKTGFSGATARAIITGVAMLKPPSFPHEIFATIEQAIDWYQSDPLFDTPRTLERAVARLRNTQAFTRLHRSPVPTIIK